MNPFKQGKVNKRSGHDFESEIAKTFPFYAEAGKAYLDLMNPPMAPAGNRGGIPLYVPNGKAPFDVYGYAPRQVPLSFKGLAIPHMHQIDPEAPTQPMMHQLAVFVGAELKASSEPSPSMRIVKPGTHGQGLAFHQLNALALLAKMGGISRIVWNNAGQIGILREAQIIAAEIVIERSLASEQAGKGPGVIGSRSIKWEVFEQIGYSDMGGQQLIDWLKI